MPDNVASVHEVTKIYAAPGTTIAVEALRGVTIEFKRGELVAIRGASGSGKSTLMNILGCLDRPTAGSYRLGDQDVSLLDDAELSHLRSRRLGFVFQNFNLIQQLTVIENLEVPLFYQSCPVQERRERAMHHIEMVGLADRSHHRPMELSGGEQQRVAIARALVNDPAIILADEPTGNLDSVTGEMILEIFVRLHQEGRTIVLVTHESHVADHCQRIITLKDGLILSDERKSGGNGQT